MSRADFTKSPVQILLDLINDDNGTSLTTSQLMFGAPTALNGRVNTQIIATATPGSPYTGSAVLTYNRVDFSSIPGNRSVVFQLGNAVNVSDLIPQINAAYQLNLTPGDFVDAPLPVFNGNVVGPTLAFELVAAYGSLNYINRVALQIARNAIPLSTVIVNTALNGLIYTQPSP